MLCSARACPAPSSRSSSPLPQVPIPGTPLSSSFTGTCSSPAQGQAPNHAAGPHVGSGRHVACLGKEAELWQCPPSSPRNGRRGNGSEQPKGSQTALQSGPRSHPA